MGVRWILVVLAILVVFGGIGAAVWRLVSNITKLPGEMVRVVVPGESEFTLDGPGTYTIFYEYKSFIGGKHYATGENLGTLEVSLTGPGGEAVTVTPSNVSSNYDVGAYSGYAVFTFSAASAGKYNLSAKLGDSAQSEAVLAIGKDFTGKILCTVFGTIGLVFGGLIAGGIVLLLALIGFKPRRAD